MNAVGDDGLEALRSVGFDPEAGGTDFDEALTRLRGVYMREESDFVKTNKFVHVKQTLGKERWGRVLP